MTADGISDTDPSEDPHLEDLAFGTLDTSNARQEDPDTTALDGEPIDDDQEQEADLVALPHAAEVDTTTRDVEEGLPVSKIQDNMKHADGVVDGMQGGSATDAPAAEPESPGLSSAGSSAGEPLSGESSGEVLLVQDTTTLNYSGLKDSTQGLGPLQEADALVKCLAFDAITAWRVFSLDR